MRVKIIVKHELGGIKIEVNENGPNFVSLDRVTGVNLDVSIELVHSELLLELGQFGRGSVDVLQLTTSWSNHPRQLFNHLEVHSFELHLLQLLLLN